MRIIHNYGLVRVISLGDPFNNTYNIQVQVKTGDTWELYHGFNSLSDDYAYTNAKEGESYSACLSKQKAKKLGNEGIAAVVRRKRAAQKKAGRAKKGRW